MQWQKQQLVKRFAFSVTQPHWLRRSDTHTTHTMIGYASKSKSKSPIGTMRWHRGIHKAPSVACTFYTGWTMVAGATRPLCPLVTIRIPNILSPSWSTRAQQERLHYL